jgi:hypothetical protein
MPVETNNEQFTVRIDGQYGSIDGWPEAREDLGLNRGGPNTVDGVQIIDQVESDLDISSTYETVVLQFDNEDAFDRARDRLFEKATERAEWGDHDGCEDVQRFASTLNDNHLNEKYD